MESAMKLTGIHHLTAVTADAPGNHAFYTEALGLRLVKKTVNQDDVSAYHLFMRTASPRPERTSPSSTGRWGASAAAPTASRRRACG
jgi:glyoxalase family protein